METNSTHKAAKQGGRRNATNENSKKSVHDHLKTHNSIRIWSVYYSDWLCMNRLIPKRVLSLVRLSSQVETMLVMALSPSHTVEYDLQICKWGNQSEIGNPVIGTYSYICQELRTVHDHSLARVFPSLPMTKITNVLECLAKPNIFFFFLLKVHCEKCIVTD